MKLIDSLVKKTVEEGWEWPEGAVEAEVFTYEGGLVNFWSEEGHALAHGAHAFKESGLDLCEIESVSRAQYEAALAKNDGWIEWGGGECPVEEGTLVDVRYRDGRELIALPANYTATSAIDASHAFWRNDGAINDIIAYRLHKPGIESRASDDRLEQDLNECIGQGVDTPEWYGDGLPPAGIDIEYRLTKVNYRNDFSRGKVIAYGISNVFMEHWSSKNEFIQPLDKIEFRPLRTEAEKAMESAKHVIAELCRDSASNGHSADLIMEAIAAGKIPGIKLEVK